MSIVTEVRCSGLSRVMACTGPLILEHLPDEDSAPAKEGTAAGRLLQHMAEGTEPGTHAENGVMFDSDMHFYIPKVFERILEAKAEDSPILCEQRIDWVTRSGIMIRGQYDQSFVGKDGKLYIDDLKYGWGIVEPRLNWQLLGYAVGEMIRRQQYFTSVVLRIHQPRPYHEEGWTRTWEISYEELLQYKEQIEARMDQIAAGSRELTTGSHCKYCPANHACPAFNRAFFSSVDYVLTHHEKDNVTNDHLAVQLQLIERIEEIVKIKKDSLTQLATYRIREGGIIPGFVMEQSYGDRKWKSQVTPKALELLTGKKLVVEEMLSPAKAEKMGLPKELIATMVERPFKGVKVVRGDAGKMADKIFNNKKSS